MKRIARSILFVPGNRPDRFEKAMSSGAHLIAIDLEDAVSPREKNQARAATAAWLAQGHVAAVRINAADTEWFNDDIKMMAEAPAAILMLPKADLASLMETQKALPDHSLIALIETVKGYKELERVAEVPGLTRIAFGSIDFGTETGITDDANAMTSVRTQIIIESCFANLEPPIDGVSVAFQDADQIEQDAFRSRQLGFGGKLCIHPKQVSAVNKSFQPDSAQVDWAKRVVAAMESSDGGATTVDGKMVDKPVVIQAHRILADFEHSHERTL
ncbi:HpcH/HpaI aldolase/citrate lyase family protein [Marinobacter salarius]|jgi:citrate lyase subunit beta/citryl-CoA lyase|uniref:HpcH/HpaI aldolase/citrate lyase family protein n=1 Tax=Marinobacter salarius TaxID=1420917 RepID=UPI0018F23DDE|nr:CoA ester lyase [Marinobacter salarius]MBJ7299111.1 CoA ester lyase [Marinobacter salarius]HIO29985.1 CoA ester lyase [Marinobacter salarius]HIP00148.1 CoA ester lyase [Marinobacter salarius]